MTQIRKKFSIIVAVLFIFNLSITTLTGTSSNAVKAAATQAKGCTTIHSNWMEEKLTYQKVGTLYFANDGQKICVKKAGQKAKILVSTKDYFSNVLTNGTKIYYQLENKVYSIDTNGKNKKTVCTWKHDYKKTVSGIYEDILYYSYRYGDLDCDQHTYTYNMKTKKTAKLFSNLVVGEQKDSYMTVVGMANDVSPVALKLYNLKTKKLTSLCKEQSGAAFVGNKVYFAKYISYNAKTDKSKFAIKYYDIANGKTVTVKTIDGVISVNQFTEKGCYYFGNDCTTKFYNYKTKKTTVIKR